MDQRLKDARISELSSTLVWIKTHVRNRNLKSFSGHVADLTKEMPYEELNALQASPQSISLKPIDLSFSQNQAVFHGQGIYMKGIAHRKPRYESISKAFDHIQKVSGPEFRANILFEYFPLAKISAVPLDSTAFRRDPTASILVLVMWNEDTKENSDRARDVAYELAEVVVEGQQGVSSTQSMGYSNYGKVLVTEFWFIAHACKRSRCCNWEEGTYVRQGKNSFCG